jgi:hypothetical protein
MSRTTCVIHAATNINDEILPQSDSIEESREQRKQTPKQRKIVCLSVSSLSAKLRAPQTPTRNVPPHADGAPRAAERPVGSNKK